MHDKSQDTQVHGLNLGQYSSVYEFKSMETNYQTLLKGEENKKQQPGQTGLVRSLEKND